MESGGGQARGGWINESVYLVSVGGWVCVCVGVLSVGAPQGVGAPPAMLRGRTAGFPKKLGGRASGEAG